jgi:signal transduction histidine kinase
MIDHLSLIKASQDLSKEIDFKRLVVKLLQNTIQNAGAQKGTLILYQNGRWQIEAEAILEQNGAFSSRLPGHLFDFYQGIPRLLIQYVMKTKKTWVSEDASRDSLFEKDTYIREQRPRSLLCTPILHQGELIGILYLENNLFKGAFTEDKVLTVQLLATQAAISLINARLYEEMKALNQQLEEKVKERTASLHRSQQETMRMVAERAVLEERQRLSKEIHDVIGHSLTVAIVQLETVRRLIQANQSSQAQQALVTSLQLIRKGQQEVRRSIRMLGEEDIAFNLEHEIDQLIHQTEATADVVVQKHIGRLPPLGLKQKRVIYQALMEGLTNGIRHARAKVFSLDLDWDGQMVIFQLQNDGEIRIPVKYGFGLTSMSHAIEELGGSMHVTADQHTFQLDIRLPWVQSGIL